MSARAAWLMLALLATGGAGADQAFAPRVLPCAGCHGEQGRATPDGYYPRIAGKPAGYLFEQLLNFRDGLRRHDQMRYFVERQREDYLHDMAAHFAALDLPYPAPLAPQVDAAVLRRGQTLAREGDAALDLPACSACHGEALTGLQPAVPGLLGLPMDYLAAQLGAWREHTRRARAPDCMAQIAQALAPRDIEALAAWLSAQPLPADTQAPAGEIASERRCGSLEPRP